MKAYGTDSFVAFEQFTTRRLRSEETANEFLTDLQRLARLVWETPPECWIKSAFVNGLPNDVKGLLRSSTRLETLTLREVLERARAVLVDTRDEDMAAVARPEQTSHTPNIPKSRQSSKWDADQASAWCTREPSQGVRTVCGRSPSEVRTAMVWSRQEGSWASVLYECCVTKWAWLRSGYPGVRQTLYFIRQVDPTVFKASVRAIVRNCKKCQSIDPSPMRWPKGKLGVNDTWSRVGMDITHYQGRHYLSLIVGPHDCQFGVV